jgi:uncharacterized small protein (TIGR04563 family)
MPQHLERVHIDWHYETAPAELRERIVRANEQLDSLDHTYHTFTEQLAEVATEEPALVADVLIDDGTQFLFHVERGVVETLVLEAHCELVERLANNDYARPPAPPREATRKYELALYYPEDMLRLIQSEATRTDKSMSWMVQFAWKTAGAKVAGTDRGTLANRVRTFSKTTRKQALFFPGTMADEIEAAAKRLECSASFVAQSAFALAREQIAALPTADELSS